MATNDETITRSEALDLRAEVRGLTTTLRAEMRTLETDVRTLTTNMTRDMLTLAQQLRDESQRTRDKVETTLRWIIGTTLVFGFALIGVFTQISRIPH